jgi:hypothetical protein
VNVSFCLDREDFTSNATIHRSEADLRGNLNLIAVAGSFDSQAVKQTRYLN